MANNRIEFPDAIRLLQSLDDVVIIMHKGPDGDTLGSGHALCAALRALGKRANVACDSPIPARYNYMTQPLEPLDFQPQHYVAVDIADRPLLGKQLEETPIALCIDHHGGNTLFAANTLLDPASASCAELIARVIDALGVEYDRYIAACLYTGITTDTGCFRYANTTPHSLRLGARLLECGIDSIHLNYLLFEEKSSNRLKLEQKAIAGIELTLDGRVALMTITQDMLKESGADAADIDGITAIPRTIEGVEAGVTLRELKSGSYKVSLRTRSIDAAALAAEFGGGGHPRAAGFECSGIQHDIKCAVVAALERILA